MNSIATTAAQFQRRHQCMHAALGKTKGLLFAGLPRRNNFPAQHYPFRASSHFLYFTGMHLSGAWLSFADGKTRLHCIKSTPTDALWHGPGLDWDELKARTGVDEVVDVAELPAAAIARGAGTVASPDAESAAAQSEVLGRAVEAGSSVSLVEGTADAAVADGLIALRLVHDEAAIAQMRLAASATARAHGRGRASLAPGGNESGVYGSMVAPLWGEGFRTSYEPIVTVNGEVLHNHEHHQPTAAGDLLLVDLGAETPEGWAGDVTRTWPVSGELSGSQKAIYELVLQAERRAVEMVAPGVEYRTIHVAARKVLVAGLVDLGILRGDAAELDARGAGELFFPHGVGHIIGLDVHDMEDLGDRAGYAPGRKRSERFGECYLRLDRTLEAGMAVTIEPGFYQVPALLDNPEYAGPFADALNRDELAKYSDVRGIRLEDDILVTEQGYEDLTSDIPMEL